VQANRGQTTGRLRAARRVRADGGVLLRLRLTAARRPQIAILPVLRCGPVEEAVRGVRRAGRGWLGLLQCVRRGGRRVGVHARGGERRWGAGTAVLALLVASVDACGNGGNDEDGRDGPRDLEINADTVGLPGRIRVATERIDRTKRD